MAHQLHAEKIDQPALGKLHSGPFLLDPSSTLARRRNRRRLIVRLPAKECTSGVDDGNPTTLEPPRPAWPTCRLIRCSSCLLRLARLAPTDRIECSATSIAAGCSSTKAGASSTPRPGMSQQPRTPPRWRWRCLDVGGNYADTKLVAASWHIGPPMAGVATVFLRDFASRP